MNEEQQNALAYVKQGKNVFITGQAGSGKSYVLRIAIAWLRSQDKRVGVTATTGCASILIKGQTIHNFLGIGLASKSASMLADMARCRKKKVYRKLRELDALIIDEISMMSDELFEKISEYLSLVRGNPEPFGGIQMLLSGDFCQLPPVQGKYCFTSEVWKQARIHKVLLNQNMRQTNDPLFQEILTRARFGRLTEDDVDTLKSLSTREDREETTRPTRLYPKRMRVDAINERDYTNLVSAGALKQSYRATYSNESAKTWAQSLGVPEELELCVGSQAMITWNIDIDKGLSNGTCGVVTSVQDDHVELRLANKYVVRVGYNMLSDDLDPSLVVRYMPIQLAFACTIHKSQGATLDVVDIHIGNEIFEYGQAYTALSRARSLKGLRINGVSASAFKAHPLVKEFYGDAA